MQAFKPRAIKIYHKIIECLLSPEKIEKVREERQLKKSGKVKEGWERKDSKKFRDKKERKEKKKKKRKSEFYSPTFGPKSNFHRKLHQMMYTNNQKGRKNIDETQRSLYRKMYKDLTPVLRLFHFFKSSGDLLNENILRDFRKIFEDCLSRDQKLQKVFEQAESEDPRSKNRVSPFSIDPRQSK